MKEFIYRNQYFVLSIVLTIPIVILDLLLNFIKSEEISVFLGIAGGMTGFLLTGMGLFYAMPFSEKIKERIHIFRYDIIIPRAFFIGVILFLSNILLFLLFPSLNKYNLYIFIVGLFQSFFCAKALYVLSFKREK